MADERKNAKLTIEELQSQLGALAHRLGDLEQVKEQHEGTIRVQQLEQSTASSQIKVREGGRELAREGWREEGGKNCVWLRIYLVVAIPLRNEHNVHVRTITLTPGTGV